MPPVRPLGENVFEPEASTLLSNGVFNFNFLALVFSEILGGGFKFTLGGSTPPSGEIFFTQSEYFTISILYAPSGTFFGTPGEYVSMSNGVFNFNFLALVFSEILGGSQIYTRGPYAPWTPPSGEMFLPKASTSQYLIVFLISTL